jgi:DNA-binding GntR family transcriptional regulator
MNNYASLHFRFVVKKHNYYSDVQQIYKDHRMIVVALTRQDVEEAKQIVRTHMQRVREKIEEELFPAKSNSSTPTVGGSAASLNF